MPPPVLSNAGLALAVLLTCCGASTAEPLDLSSESGVNALVRDMRAFREASRIRWIVAAASRTDAEAAIGLIKTHLTVEESDLAARLSAVEADDKSGPPRSWIEPQLGGAPNAACSWQVWVSDPAFPSKGAEAATAPLAPNDRIPVSQEASFRVGHAGLLQSRLYAFGETDPGAVRDLSTAPDVNIPVARDKGKETLVLVTARAATPFLESLKSALADTQGQRKSLGAPFALKDKLTGKSRGIGANIQAVSPAMILPKRQGSYPDPLDAGDFAETCMYELVRAP